MNEKRVCRTAPPGLLIRKAVLLGVVTLGDLGCQSETIKYSEDSMMAFLRTFLGISEDIVRDF